MKKTLLLAGTLLAISFTSCGGGEENKEEKKAMTVCDCMKASEDMMQEADEAAGDEAKMKEIEEKYKSQIEECKKMGEGKSEEEMKALMEEAKKCN